ncbi:MAG: bacterial translation initiation factor 2 (bIF-2) [Parcubacteria group bacterium Gr01-1014_8]|nr:MAG: bacterial translation initiation factor 2 (bIF-2) [Parcubacteria group bacterium Gr01-1014_8]
MTPTTNNTERPPIVVVMGHVDHGKSTLLDFIRKSNVVAGEAGGITQHVAAYEVEHEKDGVKKRITFIDTPGHAAFQAIRSRGANIADIAILVVAADDGVKAQTVEALASIRESAIPLVVAINKIDKPNADIARTQGSLLERGVFLEKLGGDVPWTAISAKTGTGVTELLDLVLLVAELQEYKGDASKPATGYVIEAHRDQKRGIAATLVITDGTLKSGMAIQAGRAIAPVRIMEDHKGKSIREASFSTPVLLVGFDELPTVGIGFQTFKNKRDAEEARSKEFSHQKRESDSLSGETPEGQFILPIIVRADASGSLEAIVHEVSRIKDEHAAVRIVQSEIGNISENDVKSAIASSATPATVVGFNVTVDATARERARQHGIHIETFDIIYKLTERLEELLKEAAPKRHIEEQLGRAKVLKQFGSRKNIHVIGGSVSEGKIERGCSVRVTRRKVEVGLGKITNLQSHKQNVDRVETGGEFGAEITSQFEVAQGDMLECFVTKTV